MRVLNLDGYEWELSEEGDLGRAVADFEQMIDSYAQFSVVVRLRGITTELRVRPNGIASWAIYDKPDA